MYRILVPIDDDVERGQTQVRYVAGLPLDGDEIEVVLTHVLEGVDADVPEAMQRPGRVDAVRRARETLDERGIDATVREASEPPTDGIIALADEIDADEIVMGGRNRSPAGKVLFGSVTQSILLNADLPVVVTGGT
jgi:nucleotide-binding universal stress UspA family protein